MLCLCLNVCMIQIIKKFVIRSAYRDESAKYLDEKGIGTIIHYPIPPHLSQAYSYLGIREGSLPVTERYAKTVLSIPLYNGFTYNEQKYVIEVINSFKKEKRTSNE